METLGTDRVSYRARDSLAKSREAIQTSVLKQKHRVGQKALRRRTTAPQAHTEARSTRRENADRYLLRQTWSIQGDTEADTYAEGTERQRAQVPVNRGTLTPGITLRRHDSRSEEEKAPANHLP